MLARLKTGESAFRFVDLGRYLLGDGAQRRGDASSTRSCFSS